MHVQDDSMDNEEDGKDDGAPKWQAGTAQPLEEDDDDVVNSPQDVFNRVRSRITFLAARALRSLHKVTAVDKQKRRQLCLVEQGRSNH